MKRKKQINHMEGIDYGICEMLACISWIKLDVQKVIEKINAKPPERKPYFLPISKETKFLEQYINSADKHLKTSEIHQATIDHFGFKYPIELIHSRLNFLKKKNLIKHIGFNCYGKAKP